MSIMTVGDLKDNLTKLLKDLENFQDDMPVFFEGDITKGFHGIEGTYNPCINGVIDPKTS